MKKTYINPEMTVIRLMTAGLIATSNVGLGGASNYSSGGTISGAPGFDWDED